MIKKLYTIIDKGWDIEIFNTPKRMDAGDGQGREWHIRVYWVARKDNKEKECKWEGFKTTKEAITDMVEKLCSKK